MKRWITIGILASQCFFLFLLFSNTDAELHTVKAALNFTQTELVSTKTALESTKGELVSTKTGLESTRTRLGTTETELKSTKEELHSAETELVSTLDNLDTVQAELDITRDELADLQISYEGLMTGHGYTIKDPTYTEMMRFLRADGTDKAEYIEGEYVCRHFAADLCNRAEEEGIRCAFVLIAYPDGGHTIVAFNTLDKGLIYIEPQYDDLVRVETGKRFYECIVPKAGHYYEQPGFDDTIEEVLVIW